jgi:hypothetical protein
MARSPEKRSGTEQRNVNSASLSGALFCNPAMRFHVKLICAFAGSDRRSCAASDMHPDFIQIDKIFSIGVPENIPICIA